MTPESASAEPRGRLLFLDGLRGLALILMVLNHTARDWMDVSMGWGRYYLAYLSVLLPAPIFLFLVGFCLPISFRRRQRPPLLTGVLAYARRGFVIVAAGILLNLLVFPEDPWWVGGVLQTIGLSIMLIAPALWLLERAWARRAVVVLAALLYVAFAWAFPFLTAWVSAHPGAAQVLFLDFPPWPWISAALVGLVLGGSWLEARQRGPGAERRWYAVAALAGVGWLVAFAVYEGFLHRGPHISFQRDLMLNRHWTPGGSTLLGIAGMVALLLAAAYWLMEIRKVRLGWLVILGQTALMLYFVHQVIERTLVKQILGLSFNHWALYWGANVLFVVLLVGLGWAWLQIKRRVRQARVPRTIPAR
jgi:uncharacterized membrane protein